MLRYPTGQLFSNILGLFYLRVVLFYFTVDDTSNIGGNEDVHVSSLRKSFIFIF